MIYSHKKGILDNTIIDNTIINNTIMGIKRNGIDI